MKSAIRLLPVAVLLVACDRSENTGAAKPPKAVVITESTASDAVPASEGPAPRAVLIAEPVTEPGEGIILPPAGEPVASGGRPPRRRVAVAAEKVGQGLQTAGEKTQEAAVIAEDRTREAVEIAREKTETGLRKAADATGGFLKRAGEQIEEAAKDAENP
ncbi:hypothetical protein [Luteolibacter sp. Populi]|uniref:hypothetical protein n=1 Tax=Luteolibacter sp. Populi TaxID=3230487 RepID=UPI003466FCB5